MATSSSSTMSSTSTISAFSSSSLSSTQTSIGNPLPIFSSSTPPPISRPLFSTTPDSAQSQSSTSILLITPTMGIDLLASGLLGLNLSGGFVSPLPNSSPLFSSALSAPNVTNLVTVKLTTVEDYLTCKTQFTALLISHNLLSFVDGSSSPPPMYMDGVQLNPHYVTWIRIDQSLRSWLFATLSREVLVKVHELAHSFQIWDRLHRRFFTNSLARVMELKRRITTVKKTESQSMEEYLREIKMVADSLAAINSPLSDHELVQHTLFGLNNEYESLITAITYFGNNITFEDLRSKLILHEQRVRYLKECESNVHQAFVANVTQSDNQSIMSRRAAAQPGPKHPQQQAAVGGWRGSHGPWRGGRGLGFRGGRNYQSRGGRGFNGYRGAPARGQQLSANGNISFNCSDIVVTNLSDFTDFSSNSDSNGILGSCPPSAVCQLCFSPGHTAPSCSRFLSQGGAHNSVPTTSFAPSFSAMSTGDANEALWYPDSAASSHMTPFEGILSSKTPYTGQTKVLVGNGNLLPIANIGSAQLNSSAKPLRLNSVFHVPQLKHNLISVK